MLRRLPYRSVSAADALLPSQRATMPVSSEVCKLGIRLALHMEVSNLLYIHHKRIPSACAVMARSLMRINQVSSEADYRIICDRFLRVAIREMEVYHYLETPLWTLTARLLEHWDGKAAVQPSVVDTSAPLVSIVQRFHNRSHSRSKYSPQCMNRLV